MGTLLQVVKPPPILKICVSLLFLWEKAIRKPKWLLKVLKNPFCFSRIWLRLFSDLSPTAVVLKEIFPACLVLSGTIFVLSRCFCLLCLIGFYSQFSSQVRSCDSSNQNYLMAPNVKEKNHSLIKIVGRDSKLPFVTFLTCVLHVSHSLRFNLMGLVCIPGTQ